MGGSLTPGCEPNANIDRERIDYGKIIAIGSKDEQDQTWHDCRGGHVGQN